MRNRIDERTLDLDGLMRIRVVPYDNAQAVVAREAMRFSDNLGAIRAPIPKLLRPMKRLIAFCSILASHSAFASANESETIMAPDKSFGVTYCRAQSLWPTRIPAVVPLRTIALFKGNALVWSLVTEERTTLAAWSADSRYVAIADMPDYSECKLLVLDVKAQPEPSPTEVDLSSIKKKALLAVPDDVAPVGIAKQFIDGLEFEGGTFVATFHRALHGKKVDFPFKVHQENGKWILLER